MRVLTAGHPKVVLPANKVERYSRRMVQERVIRDNVRTELAHRGLTQLDLAKVLGASQQVVSNRLTGAAAFTVAELLVIADWLEIPPGDLFEPRDDVVERRAIRSDRKEHAC